MEQKVLFAEYPCQDGNIVASITLNNPRQLHALSAEMFPLLQHQLQEWQARDDIVCVFLTSVGDRAFCAGGDVKSLQQHLVTLDDKEQKKEFVAHYFTQEYQVDYLLHRFTKPVVVWGDGIVMGGGVGLFMGCSHKVVTETTRIAMPEITIGLFPDVGATWFLNHLPQPGVGLFMGLTGASINAKDAEYLEMGDYLIPSHKEADILAGLKQIAWSDDVIAHHEQVDNVLNQFVDETNFAKANLPNFQPFFDQLDVKNSISAVVDKINCHDTTDKWFGGCKTKLALGSPISAHILFRQIGRYQHFSLAQSFQLELDLAVNVCLNGDLVEGVRALLVDKDNDPHWLYPSIERVEASLIDRIFTSPWHHASHPLRHLD